MAETALSQINAAFETMRDGGNAPSAAYYERQLLKARAIVARLRSKKQSWRLGKKTERQSERPNCIFDLAWMMVRFRSELTH